MKQKVLITGSVGFIASNFIRRALYLKSPYSFVSIDKIQKPANIYINKSHQFYIGDISNSHFINTVFEIERPNIVINFAAETHVDNSIKDNHPFIISNILGTQVIIDACVKYQTERLIQISTDEIYGHLESENEPGWTEESSANPRNPYAASKLSAELLVKAAHHTHGLQYNITRSCNNYGPRQTPDKLIPKIIKHILNNKKMPIYGQGLQIRDWMFVYDKCSAILKILESAKPNETYNISAGQELSNIEIFQRICNIMNRGHSQIEFIDDRKGHDFRYSVDSSKLKSLGWNPEYKLNDGLVETINWYNLNQWALNDSKE